MDVCFFWAFLDLSKIEKTIDVCVILGVFGPLKNRTKSMFAFFGRFWTSQNSNKVDVCAFCGVFRPLKNRKKSMFAFFFAFFDLSKIEKSRYLRFFGRFWTSHKSKKVDVFALLGVLGPLKNLKKSMFLLFWPFLHLSKIEKSRCLRFFRCFWTSQKSKKGDVCAFFSVFGPLKNRKKSMFALF